MPAGRSRRSAALLIAVGLLLPVPALRAAEGAGVANGIFLVAKPELQDPNFRETVVLITQPQSGGGPIGVIINRPTERRLREALADFPGSQASEERVYYGGPVEPGKLLFVTRAATPPKASFHVLDDVYLSGSGELLIETLKRPESKRDLRVYSGYSGWAPGQLQMEIARGGWVVFRAEPDIIFSQDPAAVWRVMIGRAARRNTVIPDRLPADSLAASLH